MRRTRVSRSDAGAIEMVSASSLLSQVKYSRDGLVPVIIQDAGDGTVLMLAYMNCISLKRTIKTGNTWFWSRSRQKYWMKGEESGHIQKVRSIYLDCDGDTLLIKVNQVKRTACHTGHRTCFYRKLKKRAI